MRTIVYMAHPNVSESSSHQFLLSSGQSLTQTSYVDLSEEFSKQQVFDVESERKRLVAYDRIIFQFQLHWYQAPAIMKLWMDQVFENAYNDSSFLRQLKQKQLGIVLIAGVKASAYQVGGKEGRTISDLLSPYELFAKHFDMVYLQPLTIHQFNYLSEQQKMDLMIRYSCYLDTGKVDSFRTWQSYLVQKLEKLDSSHLDFSNEDQMIFEIFIQELVQQADEVDELYSITEEW